MQQFYQKNQDSFRSKGGSRDGSQGLTRDLKIRDENNNILEFNNSWITTGADEAMIRYSDAAGKRLKDGGLTTSKIRNIYGEIKRIQINGYDKNRTSFLLLRPKVAYTVGRENSKEKNKDGINVFQDIFNKAANCVNDEKTFLNFCSLMEALVAYHKYYGGKD